jgi:cytochrome c-type biogenesis protein CcmH
MTAVARAARAWPLRLGACARPAILAGLLVFAGVAGTLRVAAAADPDTTNAGASVDANGLLRDPVLQARFEAITKNLRCVVCQNESIADSNVELAGDLRRQVREMLLAGKSDEAIFDYMTARYGDFVRFSTRVEPKTLLIWGAPFVMLIVGAGIVFRVVRHRSRMPVDDESSPDAS